MWSLAICPKLFIPVWTGKQLGLSSHLHNLVLDNDTEVFWMPAFHSLWNPCLSEFLKVTMLWDQNLMQKKFVIKTKVSSGVSEWVLGEIIIFLETVRGWILKIFFYKAFHTTYFKAFRHLLRNNNPATYLVRICVVMSPEKISPWMLPT